MKVLLTILFFTINSFFAVEWVNKSGKATYYASKFEGRRTTNGEKFSNKKYTAAHRTLPFGTVVCVTNPVNGKSVEVRVNDRGPFNRSLMIDITQTAAKKIGIYGKGIAKVEIVYSKNIL